MRICGILGADSLPKGSSEILMEELKALVYEGVTEFVAVMDRGIGLLAANAVLALKQENPGLRLTCLLLWEEQAADWPEPVREIWFDTMALCDREVMLERHRSSENEAERDCFLLKYCDALLLCGASAEAFEELETRAKTAGLKVRWLELPEG